MHAVAQRLLRLGLPAVAVLGLALSGCGEPVASRPSAPPAPTTSAASSTPSAPTSAPSSRIRTTGTAGSDGLTVRYLDDDGTVKTVGVEDFPR